MAVLLVNVIPEEDRLDPTGGKQLMTLLQRRFDNTLPLDVILVGGRVLSHSQSVKGERILQGRKGVVRTQCIGCSPEDQL